MGALYKGFIASAILSLIFIYPITQIVLGDMATEFTFGETTFSGNSLYICSVIGIVITGLLIWITEYYTGTNYRPVQSVAKLQQPDMVKCNSGASSFNGGDRTPALVIVIGIIMTFQLAGLFGIAIAAIAMLALAGMVVALDAYGLVTDNAGGIAEMSNLDETLEKQQMLWTL